jgi:hypothetical protein
MLVLMTSDVPVKVNAWVDAGVAPLVEALNAYDKIVTLDSCAGHDEDHGAYVLFHYQGDDPAEFASRLGGVLNRQHIEYLLRAEWRPGYDDPLLELACPSDAVADLALAVSAVRTKVSRDDTTRTELRS